MHSVRDAEDRQHPEWVLGRHPTTGDAVGMKILMGKVVLALVFGYLMLALL